MSADDSESASIYNQQPNYLNNITCQFCFIAICTCDENHFFISIQWTTLYYLCVYHQNWVRLVLHFLCQEMSLWSTQASVLCRSVFYFLNIVFSTVKLPISVFFGSTQKQNHDAFSWRLPLMINWHLRRKIFYKHSKQPSYKEDNAYERHTNERFHCLKMPLEPAYVLDVMYNIGFLFLYGLEFLLFKSLVYTNLVWII